MNAFDVTVANACSTCKFLERKQRGRAYKHAWCKLHSAFRKSDGYAIKLSLPGTMPEEYCCPSYEEVAVCEKCGRPL